jgi:hypothetical protein
VSAGQCGDQQSQVLAAVQRISTFHNDSGPLKDRDRGPWHCHGDASTLIHERRTDWRSNMNATPVGQCKVGQRIAAAQIAQSNAQHYRANALECKGIAEYWSDPIKRQYEDLARQWLVLAEQAARQGAAERIH